MVWVGEDEETFESQYESFADGEREEGEERSALASAFPGTNTATTDGLWRPGNLLKSFSCFLQF